MKTIKFFTRHVYGVPQRYVVDKGDASILQQLTGRKTLDPVHQELIRDLSGGQIKFEEVLDKN